MLRECEKNLLASAREILAVIRQMNQDDPEVMLWKPLWEKVEADLVIAEQKPPRKKRGRNAKQNSKPAQEAK